MGVVKGEVFFYTPFSSEITPGRGPERDCGRRNSQSRGGEAPGPSSAPAQWNTHIKEENVIQKV